MDMKRDELGYWVIPPTDSEWCCICGMKREHHWPYSDELYGHHKFTDYRSFVLIELAGEWFTFPHAFPRYRLPARDDWQEMLMGELGIDVKEEQLCA